MPAYFLTPKLVFPPPEGADEHGLVAIGGDARPERLLLAYSQGIFPWPHEGYPLLWFSPDEPNLYERSGAAINIPEQMLLPGVDTTPLDHPVMYYQVEGVFSRTADGKAFTWDSASRGASTLDLATAQAVEVSYLAYYRSEIGVGAHPHDIEPAEMRMLILESGGNVVKRYAGPGCRPGRHVIAITRSTARARSFRATRSSTVSDGSSAAASSTMSTASGGCTTWARRSRRIQSRHRFRAIRYSHDENLAWPRKPGSARKARRNVSWQTSRASSSRPIVRYARA